jgi:hypothetical protein
MGLDISTVGVKRNFELEEALGGDGTVTTNETSMQTWRPGDVSDPSKSFTRSKYKCSHCGQVVSHSRVWCWSPSMVWCIHTENVLDILGEEHYFELYFYDVHAIFVACARELLTTPWLAAQVKKGHVCIAHKSAAGTGQPLSSRDGAAPDVYMRTRFVVMHPPRELLPFHSSEHLHEPSRAEQCSGARPPLKPKAALARLAPP